MIVFITYVNHWGRFQSWMMHFVLLKPDVVQIMSSQLWSEVSSHHSKKYLSCHPAFPTGET